MSRLSEPAQELWQVLARGAKTWLVGGAVRDWIQNTTPGDYDFATALTPHQVIKRVLAHGYGVHRTGIRYGRVAVQTRGGLFDVTTFRSESRYYDGRHPKMVRWTRQGREDLARRDFTVNALALTREGRVVDWWDGQEDLARRWLRSVGDPLQRLQEDHIRIWRAVRFLSYAPGDWEWVESLQTAVARMVPHAWNTHPLRIGREMAVVLTQPFPDRAFGRAGSLGLLPAWPDNTTCLQVLGHPAHRLAAIQVQWRDPDWGASLGLPRRWTRLARDLSRALMSGNVPPPLYDETIVIARALGMHSPQRPILSGQDLIDRLGMAAGPQIGEALAAVQLWAHRQLEWPSFEAALNFVEKWMEAQAGR